MTIGTRIAVSHGPHKRPAQKPGERHGGTCYGCTATVVATFDRTFSAVGACGWRFSDMLTAGYRTV